MSKGIVIKDLTLGYDDKPIIENMNLSIPEGKVTVIIGANGCGKSTLLKSIARILKPTTGDIEIQGMSIKTMLAVFFLSIKRIPILPRLSFNSTRLVLGVMWLR